MKYVYIYRGTFDPLHNNHEAIIRWCLTQCEPDSTAQVVIHINSRQLDEKSTKAPASWEIRADIIRRTLVDVDIAPKGSFTDTLNWIKNKYGADSKIIQVIGSDAFDKLEANSRKYSDSINSYLVAVRSSKNEIPITLCEKPVGQIPVEVQQSTISSTAIRQLLLMGNKYALKNYVSTVTESILLSSEEYTPLHLSARNLILQNLCVLSFAVLSEIKKYFGCDVYLRHSENQGLSGDHILFIKEKDGGIKAVCKVFQKQEEAQLESDGYTLFQKHHLKTPLLYFCFENCVCIEFVRGHKPSTIEEYRRVGQAFRTLHDRTKKETIQTELSNEISHASRKMAGLKFNNPLLEKNIQEIYAILLFKYTLEKINKKNLSVKTLRAYDSDLSQFSEFWNNLPQDDKKLLEFII